MKKYKMRFSGEGFCKAEKKKKKWNAGDVVEGEFDGLLDDTYRPFTGNTLASGKDRPVTTKRHSERSTDYTVEELRDILPSLPKNQLEQFTQGDSRKTVQKLCSQLQT